MAAPQNDRLQARIQLKICDDTRPGSKKKEKIHFILYIELHLNCRGPRVAIHAHGGLGPLPGEDPGALACLFAQPRGLARSRALRASEASIHWPICHSHQRRLAPASWPRARACVLERTPT